MPSPLFRSYRKALEAHSMPRLPECITHSLRMSWRLGDSGFFVKAGLGIYAPTGTQQGPAGLTNVGNQWWTFQPNLVFSYLKDGWNLTAKRIPRNQHGKQHYKLSQRRRFPCGVHCNEENRKMDNWSCRLLRRAGDQRSVKFVLQLRYKCEPVQCLGRRRFGWPRLRAR